MICWTRLVAVTGRDEEKGILRMAVNGVSRRHFFFGSLLAGAVPTGGFGSTQSLRSMGYKSPNELLNIASVGSAGRPYEDMIGCSSENIAAIADVHDSAAVRVQVSERASEHRLRWVGWAAVRGHDWLLEREHRGNRRCRRLGRGQGPDRKSTRLN